VSTPLTWEEVPDCDAADFTVLTVPQRFAAIGDPHAAMDASPGSLDLLLELAERDDAAGLGDAPWPPHYRKSEGEGARVAPSRARKPKASDGAAGDGAGTDDADGAKRPARKKAAASRAPRVKMPLVTVANSPDKEAALAGLERWKERHPDAARHVAIEDVLVDSMRGRSSTWTRVRVNLRNVPEEVRPPQETPDPDDDPTREWRQ
jgi:hypothetical protein